MSSFFLPFHSRSFKTAFLLLVFLWGSPSHFAHAAPGNLDFNFGLSGLVQTDLSILLELDPVLQEDAKGLILQPDGKIVVAGGTSKSSNSDFALVRYNPDGSVDPTFGTNGVVTTNFNSLSNDVASAL